MIPSEEELLSFIQSKEFVNFSMIAKHFSIKNTTVFDLVDALIKKRKAHVKKLGGSKIVLVKKR